MTCPLCQDTGLITVIVQDVKADYQYPEQRPCPMGCKVQSGMIGNGVGRNGSLEGNERVLDYGLKRKKHIRAGHQKRATKHYLGH